jgi:peptide/nickel transport system permease protein
VDKTISHRSTTADNVLLEDEVQEESVTSRLRLSSSGWAGVIGAGIVLFVSIFGPYIAPFDEADIVKVGAFGAPDHQMLLGADYLGRDVLSRVLWGARLTVGLSFASTIIAYVIGVTLGIAAALDRRWLDLGLSRINDAILSLPNIMLGLLVIAAFGSSIPVLVLSIGVIYATGVFRIARSLGQDIMVMDFVEVAHARGEGKWWIITREILPNAVLPLATDFGVRFVYIIIFVSSLSFLGLGVQPPAADWGSMVRENLIGLSQSSIAPIVPAVAIAFLTVSINLVVDSVSAKAGGALSKKMI